MGIENYITDPMSHKKAHIDSPEGEKQSLIVSTRPLKEFGNLISPFLNSAYGLDMNLNGSFIAPDPSSFPRELVIENVYDGGDNVQWTLGTISGVKWTPSSTEQNHTVGGLFSLKYNNGSLGDTVQITKSGGNFDLTNFLALEFWMYVDQNWSLGDSFTVYGWDLGGASIVGNAVTIENYMDQTSLDTWQKVLIPLSDMGLAGQEIDGLRVSAATQSGPLPTWYMDDMILIGFEVIEGIPSDDGGPGDSFPVGPQIYTIQPPKEQWWHVNEITLSIAAPTVLAPNTLADGTAPYLDYTTFLGLDLENGVTYQRVIDNIIAFSNTNRVFGDLIGIPNTLVSVFGDEETTFYQVRIVNYAPLVLKGEDQDVLRIIISDDLSALTRFRIFIGGRIEYRQKSASNEDIIILNRALR